MHKRFFEKCEHDFQGRATHLLGLVTSNTQNNYFRFYPSYRHYFPPSVFPFETPHHLIVIAKAFSNIKISVFITLQLYYELYYCRDKLTFFKNPRALAKLNTPHPATTGVIIENNVLVW